MKKLIAIMLILTAVVTLASCKGTDDTPEDTTDAYDVTTYENGDGTTSEREDPPAPIIEETTTGKGEETETEDDELDTEDVTEPATEPATAMTVERALQIARDYNGDVDPDSGYKLSYRFEEMTDEGDYKIRIAAYIEEDDRYTNSGYLIITPEGKITKFDW